MEVLAPDTSVNVILFFEEVYPARAAQEQAEKSKLNAFGTLARLNPLNRPKADTVNLSKWELRYEPFWHVAARREVDYVNAVTYIVPIGNEHARWLEIEGRRHERIAGPKPRIDLPLKEICRREIDAVVYQDGLKRAIKPATLQGYIDRYKASERDQVDNEGALPPQMSYAAALQLAQSRLAAEAIDAHEIQRDVATFDKVHLYYRPVYAFEYVWSTSGKIGVIEIDGLTGDVVENGEWFRDRFDRIMTRDMLFELGAEAATALVPGGGFAIKALGKLTE